MTNEPYKLVCANRFYGGKCDWCRHPYRPVCFVFMGRKVNRWQRRCRKCAERMVSEGKAKFPG